MALAKVSAQLRNQVAQVNVKIPVISFEEDGCIIVYARSLDVSGYGKDEFAAYESFKIALGDFIDYALKKDTLHAELQRLGWHIKLTKTKKLSPPTMNELLRDNDYLSDIYNNKKFNQFPTDILLPA